MRYKSLPGLSFLIAWNLTVTASSDDREFFESKIRPILAEKCESCHSQKTGKTHGGLALDTAQGWAAGGDSGTVIDREQPLDSLLLKAIGYEDSSIQMPPEEAGGKLSDREIQLLSEWIAAGAFDPRTEVATRGGLTEEQIQNWWSFHHPSDRAFPSDRNSIDAWLDLGLQSQKLTPLPAADRRTLIRRATYDLTGLPPTPEDVDAFVEDQSPNAYEDLLNRLLASPHYGERWGRHWLDVVRYADTAGDNTDHPIEEAWRYRNWVIEAFQANMPYDRFVRDQIAGDLLYSEEGDRQNGIVATGFLAIARRFDHDIDTTTHLTLEDSIDVIGKAFTGLSIACARCHDHKYDPITANDYYALYGILQSSKFSFPGCEAKQQPRDMVPLQSDDAWKQHIAPWQSKLDALTNDLDELDRKMASVGESIGAGTQIAEGSVAEGQEVPLTLKDAAPISVHVKAGELLVLSIDPDGNYGADTTEIEWKITGQDAEVKQERQWNAATDLLGNGLLSNPCADAHGNANTWLLLDGRGPGRLLSEHVGKLSNLDGLTGWRSGDNPALFANVTSQPIQAWTKLESNKLFVHPAPDGPVAIGWLSPVDGTVTISGRIADAHPGGPNGVLWSLTHFTLDCRPMARSMADGMDDRKVIVAEQLQSRQGMPVRTVAYSVTEGTPSDVPVQLRGDPTKPGDVVPRRWLSRLGGETIERPASSGRADLARWLSDPNNPLAARVMVNRIWAYHFGQGLVATPNDFGTRGSLPSHPELLDWLAIQFMQSGWDIQAMHRLIMTSDAYRRASSTNDSAAFAEANDKDPTNQQLWRFDRRRLSGEELRDTLLLHSQQMDWTPGGPHPFPPKEQWTYTQHVPFSTFYETNRRTVYTIGLRNRRDPFLGLFDGADPNASTAVRQVTTVPTQSLYFLNDATFHQRAQQTAEATAAESDSQARIRLLVRKLFQRVAEEQEIASMQSFLNSYPASSGAANQTNAPKKDNFPPESWNALVRVLMASNEYLYLD